MTVTCCQCDKPTKSGVWTPKGGVLCPECFERANRRIANAPKET